MEDPIASTEPASVPFIVPLKRVHEDLEQAPTTASSPLNPDSVNASKAARPSKEKPSMHREPREKKESLKKREAKGSSAQAEARATPDRNPAHNAKKKIPDKEPPGGVLAPLRYKLPPPRSSDYEIPRGPVFTLHHSIQTDDGHEVQFYETSEHVYNRKGFRYTHCIADPTFPSSLCYRQSETEPFHSRFNFEDTSSHLFFDRAGRQVTTEKGFRMARANVGVREGTWYWECKITSGIRRSPSVEGNVSQPHGSGGGAAGAGQAPLEARGHVRMGWARREASLDAPVGFDAYSYGLRDVSGQRVHMSRPKDFFPPGEDIREGDVIGLEINLPSLALHRRVVQGNYNPAVDCHEGSPEDETGAPDVIRDKVPIRYKAHLYFEQFEYHPTKELEELTNPAPSMSTGTSGGAASAQEPNPTHPLVPLRTLPGSYIKVYKNGKPMGVPFTDLFAFLPPASKPLTQTGARDGLDDGMLGYFPAVSVFRGGAAEVNFGPDFWCPPRVDDDVDMLGGADTGSPTKSSRPLSERYHEQIAEDVTYDILDEVDFWLQEGGGGSTEKTHALGDKFLSVLGSGGSHIHAAPARADHQTGEIKEIVQEDE